jgi:hypothetical protein
MLGSRKKAASAAKIPPQGNGSHYFCPTPVALRVSALRSCTNGSPSSIRSLPVLASSGRFDCRCDVQIPPIERSHRVVRILAYAGRGRWAAGRYPPCLSSGSLPRSDSLPRSGSLTRSCSLTRSGSLPQ